MRSMSVQTMVVFCNDATEIRYSDGSRLQLSPCGASFTFWKSFKPRCQQSQVPSLSSLGNQRIQQRSRYVLSEFKAKVLQALEFRNQFVAHPYLSTDIIDEQSLVHIYSDIKEASWPASHTDADIKRLPDGAIHVTSIDHCVTLKLSVTKQQFSVEFLCKVPRGANHRKPSSKGGTNSSAVEHGQSSQTAPLRTKSFETEGGITSGGAVGDSGYLTCTSGGNGETFCKVSGEANQSRLNNNGDVNTKAAAQKYLPQNTLPMMGDSSDFTHGYLSGGCVYVWIVQHYGVDDCPPFWRHPLQLALRIPPTYTSEGAGHESVSTQHVDSTQKENASASSSLFASPHVASNTADIIHTSLPTALPVNCPASHLHSWKDTKVRLETTGVRDTHALEIEYAVNDGIKVLMVSGVVYRLCYYPGSNNTSIEVYPGDNSVIKSCHQPGGLACDVFFTHHIAGQDGIEERMYSTSNLPPEKPGCMYSLASVLARASRLLQLARLHPDVTNGQACWKVNSQPNSQPVPNPRPVILLEERNIASLGRFSAYSDGYVRIAFSDRTLLDWRCDLSQCIARYLHKTEGDVATDSGLPIDSFHNQRRDTSSHQSCCLLLPNGQYTWVDIQHPTEEFERYVAIAKEWRAYVNMEPSARTAFYNRQFISDPHRVVNDELKKIQNFTYVTDCLLPHPENLFMDSNATKERSNFSDKQVRPANNCHGRHAQSFETTEDKYRDLPNVESVGTKPSDPGGEMSPATIREVLSKTSQTISSIETLLEH